MLGARVFYSISHLSLNLIVTYVPYQWEYLFFAIPYEFLFVRVDECCSIYLSFISSIIKCQAIFVHITSTQLASTPPNEMKIES